MCDIDAGASVPAVCWIFGRECAWLVKRGQIVGRGPRRWLVRVFLGRERETRKRRYHNWAIHGAARRAQEYLTKMLRERDLGRGPEGSETTLNEFLDRWSDTAAKPTCSTRFRVNTARIFFAARLCASGFALH